MAPDPIRGFLHIYRSTPGSRRHHPLNPEETHGFLIFNILRTIHDGDSLAHGTNCLTDSHTLGNVLEVALRRIPITPDLNPNFVIRHRPSFRRGSLLRDFSLHPHRCLWLLRQTPDTSASFAAETAV